MPGRNWLLLLILALLLGLVWWLMRSSRRSSLAEPAPERDTRYAAPPPLAAEPPRVQPPTAEPAGFGSAGAGASAGVTSGATAGVAGAAVAGAGAWASSQEEGAETGADVPSVDVPDVDLPDAGLDVPEADLPEAGVDVPEPDLPYAGVDVPSVDVPDVDLPDAGLDVPEADLPEAGVDVPEPDLPEAGVDVPEPHLPEAPSVDVPDVGLPEAAMPDASVEVPSMGSPADTDWDLGESEYSPELTDLDGESVETRAPAGDGMVDVAGSEIYGEEEEVLPAVEPSPEAPAGSVFTGNPDNIEGDPGTAAALTAAAAGGGLSGGVAAQWAVAGQDDVAVPEDQPSYDYSSLAADPTAPGAGAEAEGAADSGDADETGAEVGLEVGAEAEGASDSGDADETGAEVPAGQTVWEAESDAREQVIESGVEEPAVAGHDHPVVDGGWSVGSAAPLDDGCMPLGHPIKGVYALGVYQVPGSDWYDATVADVWFTDEGAAARAGFRRGEG